MGAAMPSRKLAKSRYGRNRHDHLIEIGYRTNGGLRSVRSVVLYAVRVRFDGLVMFDGYDSASRAELTFGAGNVEWLADMKAGRTWTEPRAILGFLLDLHRRQRRCGATVRPPAKDSGRSRVVDLRAYSARRFRMARPPMRLSDPKGRPH